MNVAVGEPATDGSTVTCEVSPSRRLRRFFTGEPFRAEYDYEFADLPPGLSTVPVLAHVCPVAWANGADVSVPVVDQTFLSALGEVRDALCRMYPEFMEGGAIHAAEVLDTRERRPAEEFDGVGALFSGGVDSVATYVRHREEDPTLISVQGWVVGADQDDRWDGVRRHVARFAAERGLDARYAKSNMLSFLDTPMLQAHYQRYVDGAWYSSVGHGLGLLGLCAPLAYGLGLGTVHIAATHTEEFEEPWGSHPDIDDRVRYGHTEGNHDGYELSRQQKLDLIADYVRSEDAELTLRTCTDSDHGGNCNDCEKCYRTMCGLVLAGLDPNEFGYETTPETFPEVREAFQRGEFVMGEDERFMWRDIQEHATPDREFPVEGAAEFFEWLSEVEVDALAASATAPRRQHLVQAVARHVPYPAYAALYPVYDTLKGALSAQAQPPTPSVTDGGRRSEEKQ